VKLLNAESNDGIDVSIVIPVRNGGEFVMQAIKSVIDSASSELNYEVIVSENFSSDNTKEELQLCTHPAVSVITPTRPLRISENWDFVCSLARGRYIKLLCADDLLVPGSLEKEVKALDQNPTALASFASRTIIGPEGKLVMERTGLRKFSGSQEFDPLLRKSFLSGTNVFGEPGCVLFRREVLISTLPWSVDLPFVIDLDFYIRAFKGKSIFIIEDSTSRFRIHGKSVTSSLSKEQSNQFLKLLERNTYVFKSKKLMRVTLFYIRVRATLNEFLRNRLYEFATRYR
jgi:glycosyltransferase involved in cell wall biosynthesis